MLQIYSVSYFVLNCKSQSSHIISQTKVVCDPWHCSSHILGAVDALNLSHSQDFLRTTAKSLKVVFLESLDDVLHMGPCHKMGSPTSKGAVKLVSLWLTLLVTSDLTIHANLGKDCKLF